MRRGECCVSIVVLEGVVVITTVPWLVALAAATVPTLTHAAIADAIGRGPGGRVSSGKTLPAPLPTQRVVVVDDLAGSDIPATTEKPPEPAPPEPDDPKARRERRAKERKDQRHAEKGKAAEAEVSDDLDRRCGGTTRRDGSAAVAAPCGALYTWHCVQRRIA